MTAYYNEHDPFAAEWLRQLMKHGHIAEGIVDERDIQDVVPSELEGFTQCHFFAGIGGWSRALRLAGWPDNKTVWTGSCPCQPFSQAGKGKGSADKRHLWPAFHYLIAQLSPPIVFGEQVASKDGIGWFDLVQADLEGAGYATAAVDLCAAGIGAPHIRQRLWFVAERVADSRSERLARRTEQPAREECKAVERSNNAVWMADTRGARPQNRLSGQKQRKEGHAEECRDSGERQLANRSTDATNGFWRDAYWLYCRDGKFRPVEPGSFPLAHGISNRVGKLRGYGNAIVPQVAQAFIESYLGR